MITFGPVIRLIKAASFKDEAGTARNHTLDFPFLAFRAFANSRCGNGLKLLKAVTAGVAKVLVRRHRIIIEVTSASDKEGKAGELTHIKCYRKGA